MRVAVFTDNDFGKVNGVTTTWRAVLDSASVGPGVRMYTAGDADADLPDYFSAASIGVGLPWYGEMRVYLPRLRRFQRELERDRTTVVHVATPGPVGLAGRWLARRAGLPLVGSYHTQLGDYVRVFSGSNALGSRIDDYVRWFYRPCASVLVPSRATAKQLTVVGYRAAQLAVWSRGVDVDRFSPARRSVDLRRAWQVDDRRPAILYAGRLSSEKGLGMLGDVQRQLHRHATPHRFVLVGDGPMRAELQRLVPDAVFTGSLHHDDVAIAMASSDLFLFPSETDTFGNVVLEAQASGVPVIVSDRGGPCEQVESGVTGEICPAGAPLAFAGAAARLLRDLPRRHNMSTVARQRAMHRTWEASLRPLFDAWNAAAHGPAASVSTTGEVPPPARWAS